MRIKWLIPIVGIVTVIGVSIIFISGQNTYESEEYDFALAELENLSVKCNNIHDLKSYNSYIDYLNSFPEEYKDSIEIVSEDSKINMLLEDLVQCKNEKQLNLITYEPEEHDLVLAGFEDLLVECNNIHSYDSYISYSDHYDSLVNEYGEFDKSDDDFVFVTLDSKILMLMEDLTQCENEKESVSNTYEPEEYELVVAELENLLVECNSMHNLESYNSYIVNLNSFIMEYGWGAEIVFGYSKINMLMEDLTQCKNEQDSNLATYEPEEYDLVVAGFENLLVKCNSIRDLESYNSFLSNRTAFIKEYGEFNESKGAIEIVTSDSKINMLMEDMSQCGDGEEIRSNTYEPEEYDLVVAGFEDLLVKCNSIHDLDTYSSFINHHNSFVDEYGEFNKFLGTFEITSMDPKIGILIKDRIQCVNEKESNLIAEGVIEE